IESLLVPPVNAVVQLGVLLNSRTRATPEGLVFGIEGLPGARGQREIVLRVSNLRPNRADAMIEQQTLIVIKQRGRGIPAVEMSCQPQHVVSAAAFRRVYALFQLRGQASRRSKPSFSIAGPARDIGTSGRDFIKEVLR